MGIERTKKKFEISSIWKRVYGKYLNKPVMYLHAIGHIISKIQPFFSILVAILIAFPSTLFITTAISNINNLEKDLVYKEGVLGSFSRIDPLPQVPLDKPLSQINRDISRLLFDPLISTDSKGTLIPVLADSYQVKEGGSKYVIKLKVRVWSNGNAVTSQDVLDTFDTIKKIGSSGIYFPAVDGAVIKIIDNTNFEFDLESPNSAFLETLNWPILPSSELKTKPYDILINSNFGVNPINNTNWRLRSIGNNKVSINNIETKKNIEFLFFNENAQLEKSLNAGLIDGYFTLNPIQEKNYENLYKFPLVRQLYSMYFNSSDSTSSELKNPDVRKAISYAIDRSAVVNNVGNVRQSVILDNSWAFDPNVNTYKYDTVKSEQILEAAGYKREKEGDFRKQNGKILEFTLSIPDLLVRETQAKIMQSQLAKVGIRMNIKLIKDAQLIDNILQSNLFYKSVILTKNFDAVIYSVDSGLDPDKFSQWHSSKIPDYQKNIIGLNFSGYSNVRVDAFLRQGRVQYEQNSRKIPYSQFQKVFYEDATVVTLYNPYLFYVTSNRVTDIDFENVVRIEDRFANFDKWEIQN